MDEGCECRWWWWWLVRKRGQAKVERERERSEEGIEDYGGIKGDIGLKKQTHTQKK